MIFCNLRDNYCRIEFQHFSHVILLNTLLAFGMLLTLIHASSDFGVIFFPLSVKTLRDYLKFSPSSILTSSICRWRLEHFFLASSTFVSLLLIVRVFFIWWTSNIFKQSMATKPLKCMRPAECKRAWKNTIKERE